MMWTRYTLIRRAKTEHARIALRRLSNVMTDDELEQWQDRSVWRQAAERWRAAGDHRQSTADQYYYLCTSSLELLPDDRPVVCGKCGRHGHNASSCPKVPSRYCGACYNLPHRRPQDGPCVCGQYYEGEA